MRRCLGIGFLVLGLAPVGRAAEPADLQTLLAKEIVGPRQSLIEVKEYVGARLPRLPRVTTREEWEREADRIRAGLLERVVYRGEAAAWREAKTRVAWLGSLEGGPGYKIKKLRYEVVPGLWVPAVLYEPDKLTGKVPVSLAVNGHDGNGKAADYKQIRCINMVKRGMIVLNPEWFGMGQLRTPYYTHGRMNQLDLCGTSGLAPFYLALKRGLDVLLAHDHADPKRVAVSGLSGGGWQTIYISSLDTRVTLSNPVAGYSGFRTRLEHHKDLGDSEQTPCDMATIADYTHLTALMAPRPTLLTYNSKDNCCFESGYALPPLLDAARPVFKLYGKEEALHSHVNDDPGNHNFGKDNRQAFYRVLGIHFFTGDKSFQVDEIPCDKEIKSKEALAVDLPADNANLNSLALALSKVLPKTPPLPREKEAALEWQRAQQQRLREVVKAKNYEVTATRLGGDEKGGVRATFWRLKLGDDWSVPVVELVQGRPKGTAILIGDAGRKVEAKHAARLLAAGQRVLAVDPLYLGESKIEQRDYLFALLIATVGERLLGLQASQVAAVARWSQVEHKGGPVTLVAAGPRCSTIALVVAGLEPKAIGGLELHGALGSLKQVIEDNRSFEQMPEMFCFGLLEAFDIKPLAALIAPRPVHFAAPADRIRKEMAGLEAWYATLGGKFELP